MKSIFFIIFVLGILVCGYSQKIHRYVSYTDTIAKAKLNCEEFANNELIISSPFNPDEALIKAIGGNSYLYIFGDDSSIRQAWYCNQLKTNRYEGWDIEDTFQFPYANFNETTCPLVPGLLK